MVIICIVGDLRRNNNDARSKIFEAIKSLPVCMVSYGGSEYNFSFLVKKAHQSETIKILSENLFN